LAVAVNSPMLLGRRLWQETRIALFQHAVDERWHSHIARDHPTRVSFGDAWVQNSVLEIYKEQVARFRVIMTTGVEEDSLKTLARGGVPALKSLVLHNSTVWRWNRPCYGITAGRPHLRLEFRALPAGPTVLDEVANAAFFIGLMRSLPKEYGNISTKMQFDDAKDNFFAAARHGLKAQLTWLDGKHYSVRDLVKHRLLPLASQGLRDARINTEDIDLYLGVIQERVETTQTGSQWMLSAAASLSHHTGREMRDQRLVAAMLVRQKTGDPVHRWDAISKEELDAIGNACETVAEIMSTDLFTVSPDDPITLAASMMDWRHIRHLPVEQDGRLAGLISSRDVLHFIAVPAQLHRDGKAVSVGELMNSQPPTVTRETPIAHALNLMLQRQMDCLPVTEGNELIGIVTSHDMLQVLSSLLRRETTPSPDGGEFCNQTTEPKMLS
jgi:CBS domain-containing protein